MTTKRLYRVKYRYRDASTTYRRGTEHTAKLTVEQPSIAAAVRVATTIARRCCRSFGDEVFLRVVSVREKGQVDRG